MKRLKSLFLLSSLALTACQTTPSAPDRYAAADTNANGSLSAEEISDYMVTSIFDGRDANNDGQMTKSEWIIPNYPASIKSFAQRDANKDGVVTMGEAKEFAKKAGSYKDVVKEADTNKDSAISREEAKAYYASKEGPAR